jgi:hypothetical protein
MLRHPALKQWNRIVSAQFPHLSISQVTGLSTWSFGIALTQSSSLSRVSQSIALLNDERANTVRQRLKEWYEEASAKSGTHRWEWQVEECFVPLLRWVMSLLPRDCRELFLAMDVTTQKDRLTVLSIAVQYRGSAIPVAWKILRGKQPGEWRTNWEELFVTLAAAIDPEWRVVVCADRGLYADWLFATIQALGWHPFLRVNQAPNKTVQCLPDGVWQPLAQIVGIGEQWQGFVRCFHTNPLECTLLARWNNGYKDPWLVVTDLAPDHADVLWYSYRTWIEHSYRDLKSDGWGWQSSRITDPKRAERQWLAMAVATLWMLTLGTQAELEQAAVPQGHNPFPNRPTSKHPQLRRLSCFALGLIVLPILLSHALPLKMPPLLPQPTLSLLLNST